MIPLKLPQLSISMEEGTILSWLVADGAEVKAGQPLVEVETDKATLEVESPADGVLRIVAEEGATLPVDALLAEIGSGLPEPAGASPPVEGGSPPQQRRAVPAEASKPQDSEGQVASPAARRLARERGVDLTALTGSGPGGRVVFADVERAAAAPEPAGSLRGLVIESIAASWREIPHIHIAGELAADGLAEARRLGGGRYTVTDLLVHAVARALLDVPDLNGVLRPDGSILRGQHVHLALAVATPDGVVAPVVRGADALGLEAVAAERARVVGAARAGRLEKRDLGGATCTFSNLGAYPVDFFAPVISGPQIALVASGRLVEKPVVIDGMLGVRFRLWVNAAIDHRGADGEAGGRFLAALERRFAELPEIVEGRGV